MNTIEVNIFFRVPAVGSDSSNEIKEFKTMLPFVPSKGDSIGLWINNDYFPLTVQRTVYYIESADHIEGHRNLITLVCKIDKNEKPSTKIFN